MESSKHKGAYKVYLPVGLQSFLIKLPSQGHIRAHNFTQGVHYFHSHFSPIQAKATPVGIKSVHVDKFLLSYMKIQAYYLQQRMTH